MSTDDRDDLRATAEDLIADAEKLKAIEERKLAVDPSSPAIVDLSQEAEKVARQIVNKTRAETKLAEQLS